MMSGTVHQYPASIAKEGPVEAICAASTTRTAFIENSKGDVVEEEAHITRRVMATLYWLLCTGYGVMATV